MRRLIPIAALALLAAAVWNFLDDRAARAPLADAVSRFTIDVRRPIETTFISHAPSADFATQALSSSAISDALGRARLAGLPPAERRAWFDVPVFLDEELETAIRLQLAALRRNPGWPLHRYYLGKLAYTRDRRSLGGEAAPGTWLPPLISAWRGAPGNEPAVETLAGVMLEAWRVLPENDRGLAEEVLQAALADPQFVNLAFDVAVDVVGRDAAFASLPDEPGVLLAATRSMGRRNDVEGAALLYERWEAAEWVARASDLETVRHEMATGDLRGLTGATAAWVARHRPGAFDTSEAHRQDEEILRLWPKDQLGAWGRDPRTDFVRFFLDGRLGAVDASVLDATVSAIANAPSPVRARTALAAGNPGKAESIVARAGNEGAFEWTDYFVDLANRAIDRNGLDAAIEAIGRISPSARGECDVVVVRRRAGEDIPAPPGAVTDADGNIVAEAWSANGMLGLCVDPVASGARTLVVDVSASSPVLLEWGLNRGRRDTVLVRGSERIALPLSGLRGRNVLYTKVLWGEGTLTRTARLE